MRQAFPCQTSTPQVEILLHYGCMTVSYERKQGQCILMYCLEYYLAEVEKIMKNHSQDNCLEEV
jgi:hypothetical protein